ncbi:MAG: glycosyltransferase family 4 protein [Solirubrobacterales bacterium]|nr:glycosyltransferase family 4 protein [Solirubrobacterales bacterium]
MIVHQVLSGAGPVDAVTVQALRFRELFRGWGWGGDVFAGNLDPRVGRRVRPLGELAPEPDATILVHYSAYAPRLRGVLDLPQRKVLLSHNVTPPRWFWDHEPMVAIQCALGRRQLPEFAARCDVVAGVSAFNAAELGSDRVVPILVEPASMGEPRTAEPGGPPTLLFVGRLAPHKRQDELIRLVALLRRHRLPDARLRLVGSPLHPRFERELRTLADALAPGAVTIESGLDPAALAARYREAHALVCLSEHEGFCIPLLEAFHHGVPVVARPVGGIPEVAGDAALLVEDRDLAVLAELVAMLLGDAPLRHELRARGRARLAAYAPDAVAAQLRALLEP